MKISRIGALAPPVVLAVVIALFLPSYFGDDAVNVMPQSDVQGVLGFYQSARPGTIFSVADNAPLQLSGRYNLFGSVLLYGPGGVITGPPLDVSNAAALTSLVKQQTLNRNQPAYVIITKSMENYASEYGFLSAADVRRLRHTLSRAPGWFEAYNAHGVTAFELPPSG
jgi:hypothetical protein